MGRVEAKAKAQEMVGVLIRNNNAWRTIRKPVDRIPDFGESGLKSHYITVQKGDGLVLRGKAIPDEAAKQLILKKAKRILNKLELVKSIGDEDIVTGSRIQYLGRKYYVEVFMNDALDTINIVFTESNFRVSGPNSLNNQAELRTAFENFFREKAGEKIAPRKVMPECQ